jgi:hypothetical protein
MNTNPINPGKKNIDLPYSGKTSDIAREKDTDHSPVDEMIPSLDKSPESRIYSSNAMLIGHTNDKTENDFDIAVFERNLAEELGENARICNECDIADIPGSIPDMSQLQEVFNECANDKSIPWDFLYMGCESRAYASAAKVIDKGFNCAKIFVELENEKDPDVHNRLKAENEYSKGEWRYHTGALVFARDEKSGEIDGYVIDPSINRTKPLKPGEWISGFRTRDCAIRIDITQADVKTTPIETTYGYSLIKPRDFSRERFDEGLSEALQKNEENLKALESLKYLQKIQVQNYYPPDMNIAY